MVNCREGDLSHYHGLSKDHRGPMENKITKLLIANRGEIALRIQRACEKRGIASVSVASEADAGALFARKAEELVIIGPAAASASYLNVAKLLAVARERGCNAVHPGYGFLSENALFARAVREAGLIFVGPRPESIETLGSKTSAREAVRKVGVPTTEGAPAGLDDEALVELAVKIGFPVIIKAAAGGGGRGMRIVRSVLEMRELLPLARAEAKKFFGDPAVYFEQYIERPRHVEVQVFGDRFGNVVHFGTRDCSTQRRHQKLVEEAPAPNLSDELRERLHSAAVNAAKSVGYENAGTAEFLVKDDKCFFLEMNTRIQVEHPVSEAISGVDLVDLQLAVAEGAPLPYSQRDITFSGHAIEFRIYAEDPAQNFAPSVGKITTLHRPTGEGIRDDYACEEGDEVSVHYDAMISKLILFGKSRADALIRARRALAEYRVEGPRTTLPFHRWLVRLSPFGKAPLDIGYLEREFSKKSLESFHASEQRDPVYRPPLGACEQMDRFAYFCRRFAAECTIEVVHHHEGYFVAYPVVGGEAWQAPECCQASNSQAEAVGRVAEYLESASLEERHR